MKILKLQIILTFIVLMTIIFMIAFNEQFANVAKSIIDLKIEIIIQ